MKRSTLKPVAIKSLVGMVSAMTLLASCGEKEKKAPAEGQAAPATEAVPETAKPAGIAFDQEALTTFFAHYLDLQEALVASDPAKVEAVAREMEQVSLEGMPEVSESVAALAKSDHLGRQRAVFYSLNKALQPYLEAHLSSGAVYQQFCPMAFDNTGAFWFSDSEEILNPYFGDAMLRCGKVEKTFGTF